MDGCLIKIVKIGDELKFDLSAISQGARKEISVFLVEKAGRSAVLKITADKSIPIQHFKMQTVG
jgi:hypothetical protein